MSGKSSSPSFVCASDKVAATHFCVCQSQPVFLCNSCLSKHKEEPLHDTFPISNIGFFQVLNYNKAELKRRRDLSSKCTAFLDQVILSSAVAEREAYAVLKDFNKHYLSLIYQRTSLLRDVVASVRYELSTLMKKRQLELSQVPEALVKGVFDLEKANVSEFARLQESTELQSLSQRCEDALNRAPRVWQQHLEGHLLHLIESVSDPQPPLRFESMPGTQSPAFEAGHEVSSLSQSATFTGINNQGTSGQLSSGFQSTPGSSLPLTFSQGQNQAVRRDLMNPGLSSLFSPRAQTQAAPYFSPQENPAVYKTPLNILSPKFLGNVKMSGSTAFSQRPNSQGLFGGAQPLRQDGFFSQMGSGNQQKGGSGLIGPGASSNQSFGNQGGGPSLQGFSAQASVQGQFRQMQSSPAPQNPTNIPQFSATSGGARGQFPPEKNQSSGVVKPVLMTTKNVFNSPGANPSVDSQALFPMRSQTVDPKPQIYSGPQPMQGSYQMFGGSANLPAYALLNPVQNQALLVPPAQDFRGMQRNPSSESPYYQYPVARSGPQTCVQCGNIVESDLLYTDIACESRCTVCKRCVYISIQQGIYQCPSCSRHYSEEEVQIILVYGLTLS